ncbi:centlein [Hoplias malabaricus]|uniref:centlein n=1 Tax=Hoplias malabaricus TaxID=27720 RepID=UPI0034628EAC
MRRGSASRFFWVAPLSERGQSSPEQPRKVLLGEDRVLLGLFYDKTSSKQGASRLLLSLLLMRNRGLKSEANSAFPRRYHNSGVVPRPNPGFLSAPRLKALCPPPTPAASLISFLMLRDALVPAALLVFSWSSPAPACPVLDLVLVSPPAVLVQMNPAAACILPLTPRFSQETLGRRSIDGHLAQEYTLKTAAEDKAAFCSRVKDQRLPRSSPARMDAAVSGGPSLAFYSPQPLSSLRAQLEEELDVARVQAAVDRAATQELRIRLQQQHELQLRGDEKEAISTTPVLPSAQKLDKSIKKMETLERKMECLETELEKLKEENQTLQEAAELLSQERSDLQAALKRASSREQAETERLRGLLQAEVESVEERLQSCRRTEAEARREAAEARRAEAELRNVVLRFRQELGVLRAERDFHRAATRRWSKATSRVPVIRPRGPSRTHTHSRSDQLHRTHTHTRTSSEKPRRTHTHSEKKRRTHSPAKDEWEDMSPDSETEEFSDSLESRPPSRARRGPSVSKGGRYALAANGDELRDDFSTNQPQRAPGTERKGQKKTRRMKNTVLHHRLLSLQQQLAVLQSANRAATQTAEELREKHIRAQTELETLTHRLQASKQLSQKQVCELVMLQQQKAVLEMELEQWRKSLSPQDQGHTAVTADPKTPASHAPPAPDPQHPTLKHLEADIKQLNSKLKGSSAEVTRQSSVIKGLRTELHERDQRLKELQEKLSHTERDVVMKKQLVEDLRSRMKVLQDSESSRQSLITDLERKVKSQGEEASNRKVFLDSLKRRLSAVTQEKNQCESSSQKLREDLQRKDQKLSALQVSLSESERMKMEMEEKTRVQLQLISQQHSDALQQLHNKLGLAQSQQKQLRSFTQALVVELAREVEETRAELRKRRRERNKRERPDGGVSRSSMQKAQSIAASILNLSQTDLASILDTEEEEVCDKGTGEDWMNHVRQILQQQVPSAALLLEVVMEKMKEFRSLTKELESISEKNN